MKMSNKTRNLRPYGKVKNKSAYDNSAHTHDFASAGSALRTAGKFNPRNLPCPTCGRPNRLTPADRDLGYQCDTCANQADLGY